MPYIKLERRKEVQPITHDVALDAGELNFQLTCIIKDYLQQHGLRYQIINDITGAMENCSDEFKIRVRDPYERQKAHDNGDVY